MKPFIHKFMLPVVIYPHRPYKDNRRIITGRYVNLDNIFVPNVSKDLNPQQFIGVHQHMVVTIATPGYIKNLLGIALDLNNIRVKGKGYVTWLGTVRCYPAGHGCRLYIPSKMWNPKSPEFAGPWRTTGAAYWWANGKESEPYFLVDIPALTREKLLDEMYERSGSERPE